MIYRSPLPDVHIPEVPLPEYLFDHAAQWSDKAALIDGPSDRTITYAQLTTAVDAVAAGLAIHKRPLLTPWLLLGLLPALVGLVLFV